MRDWDNETWTFEGIAHPSWEACLLLLRGEDHTPENPMNGFYCKLDSLHQGMCICENYSMTPHIVVMPGRLEVQHDDPLLILTRKVIFCNRIVVIINDLAAYYSGGFHSNPPLYMFWCFLLPNCPWISVLVFIPIFLNSVRGTYGRAIVFGCTLKGLGCSSYRPIPGKQTLIVCPKGRPSMVFVLEKLESLSVIDSVTAVTLVIISSTEDHPWSRQK